MRQKEKTCNKCGETKLEDKFCLYSVRGKVYRRAVCKDCFNANARAKARVYDRRKPGKASQMSKQDSARAKYGEAVTEVLATLNRYDDDFYGVGDIL